MLPRLFCCGLVIYLSCYSALLSAREDRAVRYRSPEERREAGLGTELNSWLKFYGLVEMEGERERLGYADGSHYTESEPIENALQVAFESEIGEWFEAEIIFEVEQKHGLHSKVDEAMFGFKVGDFGLNLGLLYLPTGEYYSHFITSPLLEFSETRQKSFVLDWAPYDLLELSVFVFEGDYTLRNNSSNQEKTDWGAALEWQSKLDSVRFGMSYLSDQLEEENSSYQGDIADLKHSPGVWNIYGLWGITSSLELTLETTRSVGKFRGWDSQWSQPRAENLEVAWFVSDRTQLSFRFEHAKGLEDEPEWRYGLSIAWRPIARVGIAFDALYADFPGKTQREEIEEEDSEDEPAAKDGVIVAAAISVEF